MSLSTRVTINAARRETSPVNPETRVKNNRTKICRHKENQVVYLRAHQLLLLLLLEEFRVLMLIDLARWHLLRMAPRPGTGSTRLWHSAGGRRPLPQTLLSEIDGLGLRDRAVGVSLISRRPGLILRLLLIEVHALLRRDRHDRFQITRELHMLAR